MIPRLAVRKLLSRAAATRSLIARIPIVRLARPPHRLTHASAYATAAPTPPKISSGILSEAKSSPLVLATLDGDWDDYNRGGGRDGRSGGVAVVLTAGLVLCAASNGRGTSIHFCIYRYCCSSVYIYTCIYV